MNNLIIAAACAVVAIVAVIAILVSQKNKKKKAELLNLQEKTKQQKPARKRHTPANPQGIDIDDEESQNKTKIKVKPRVLPKTQQEDESKVRENAVLDILDSQNHSEVDILKQTLDIDLSENLNVNVLNVNRAEEKVPTVLIVDDSRTSLKSATRALEKNYTIITAEDGIDALEKMQITKPDLVVTDVDMPRMTGLELVTRMKENFFFSDIPIIVVTGNLELHFQIGAHEGIDSFLPKPYSPDDLLGQAKYLLKR